MAFDQLLRRNFWVVMAAMLGAAAFLDAQGCTQLVGSGLSPDEKELATPPLTSKLPPKPVSADLLAPSAANRSADPILSRNPFDSVTGPLNSKAPASEESPAAQPDLSDPKSAPPCDGIKVLVIAASADPEWSFAAFQGSDKKSLLRRRGGEVGGKTIKFIGWDRVWMNTGAQLCQAEMFHPPPPAGAPTPPPGAAPPVAAPPAAGGAHPVPGDIAKGISRKGPTEFDVDRGVVDKILENQAELMRQARIVPEQENGKVVGIRLFGVRPDTLLGVLGMENGDRLEKINGFEMASPEKALEAYARLRTADHLTVSVNRRGQAVNLDYNIK